MLTNNFWSTKIWLLLPVFLWTFPALAQEKLNIVLFLVDDLGYYDLSFTGSELYETHNIDALAAAGVWFSNAYVAHPRCVPSRYALQTGKFPARSRIPGDKGQIGPTEQTLGLAFQQADYTTFFAGKWHLGKKEAYWPQHQGYDINVGGCAAGAPISYFYPYNRAKPGDKSNHREIVDLEDGTAGAYLTDHLTDKAIAFIRDHKDGPFFATLAHYAVHTPFQAKPELVRKYRQKLRAMKLEGPEYLPKDGATKMLQDNAVYAAMIESMDKSLGRLVRVLKEEGLYDNTVIIFTSDHGGLSNRGASSQRQLATANLPLRAGKGHVYEGGIKVPFILRMPGTDKAGSVCTALTINTDIFPTLLDIAGIPLRPDDHLDGRSMLPLLRGEQVESRTFYWHSPRGRPGSTGDRNCSAIRTGNLKLIDFYEEQRLELYDLEADPYEANNLVNSQAKLAEELHKKLNQWKKTIHAIQ
ncbi:sulfatase [Flavilitoribacter nigricans]|uniref:Sulfatase n=1 Tax=Flavilitoribacter nigricans (strain ATCC 23147 / DSM 23189 / NBRC 102662 / NCIMB 1420 / SS-2) TaxID=1122177 RepID=A0A2D0NDS7_FLAN2|nr:sulfatase [Flavilitoribacter nigricans]PHN06558.1 sulfatase [Flavilitoribacter nigricans DSM 23189 = NBRC 102662]